MAHKEDYYFWNKMTKKELIKELSRVRDELTASRSCNYSDREEYTKELLETKAKAFDYMTK